MTTGQPRRTPLYETHIAAGARMVSFAGWEMPVQYAGVIAEVTTCRTSVGLFDVSHMGEFKVSGPGALAWLNAMATNDVARLTPGRAHYSLLLDDEAGILDDILIYRLGDDDFLLVVNAGNRERDWEWLRGRSTAGVELEDVSDETALIAVQGPRAAEVLQPLTTGPLGELRRFRFAAGAVAGVPCLISRTGYTGEDGFELFTQGDARIIWAALRSEGGDRVAPCGLGARDVLRIEAGNVLYGHEIWEEVNPLSAGLMWTVQMEKGAFVGREALEAILDAGAALVLAGLQGQSRAIPRQHYAVNTGGEQVGEVTSGTYSPTLGLPIAMAYLAPNVSAPGSRVDVIIRDRPEPAVVCSLPFYRAPRP